jgi:hypothetical protein
MAPTGPSKNTSNLRNCVSRSNNFFEPSLFGPYGAIKKHFELAKLCFAFEQFFEPSLFDTPYNKWYCK